MFKFFKLVATTVVLAVIALPVQAYEQGDWILRAGVGVVDPKSTGFSDPVEDLKVVVDSGTSLTLTGAYMMTDNWAFEVLASWPFNHDIKIGAASGGPTVKIAETDHLPPTFSLQYFFPTDGGFKPYAGVGLNWTTFFNTDIISDPALQGVTLDLDDSFGVAAQLGADFMFNESWLINVDLRWINIETDATLSDGLESDTIKVEIDPLVYSVNLGFLFN